MTCFDFRSRYFDVVKGWVIFWKVAWNNIVLFLLDFIANFIQRPRLKPQALKKCWTEGKNESHEEKKLSSTRNVFNGYRILTVMLSAFHIDKADRKKPDGTWCLKYVHIIKSMHTRSRIKIHLETYFCQNHYLHRYKIIICHWLK